MRTNLMLQYKQTVYKCVIYTVQQLANYGSLFSIPNLWRDNPTCICILIFDIL